MMQAMHHDAARQRAIVDPGVLAQAARVDRRTAHKWLLGGGVRPGCELRLTRALEELVRIGLACRSDGPGAAR